MINVSNEFIQLVSQNTGVEVKATLTLADGTVRYLTGDDFMMGTTVFSDATSSSSKFDIGAAIIGQFDVSLNNYDGRFNAYDFTGARIVPYVGVRLSNGNVEWVRKGRYTVDQPDTYGNVIGLTCLDDLSLLEVPYSEVSTVYPTTLQLIARDIAVHCGVTLEDVDFANCDYVVAERPDDSSVTCLAMLSYVCQVAGCFARMTNVGTLRIAWYDTAAFESEDWLDGETFDDGTPYYQSGDTADGGAFHSGGDSCDGGAFIRRPWVGIHAYTSMTVCTDDVVVTGVEVTAQDDKSKDDGGSGNDGETTLFGSRGYVIAISDNPLIAYGRSSEVANRVGQRVVGMRFRPFEISALGDPSVEAGDPVVITHRDQVNYVSYITSLTYKVNAYASVACDAETPARHTAKGFSAVTKAIVDARNAVKRERTARELAVENLATELSESSGLYLTKVAQQDGSYIYYMHDKPTLAESMVVWKMTATAIGISTDGGTTYPYGLDVSGNAILQRIYTIGLDASYITTGTLDADLITTGRIRSASGNSFWDLDTGAMQLMAYAANIVLGRMNANGIAGKITLGGDGMKYETALGQLFDVSHGSTVTYQGRQTQTGILTLGDTNGTRLKISTDSGSTSTPYVSVQALNGHLWLRGSGASGATADVTIGSYSAKTYINGQLEVYPGPLYGRNITETSDKRLKDHIAYLGDKAREFVRKLKPALFSFKDEPNGKCHTGFYAQDVRDADPWGSETVIENGEGKLFLNYSALIAPLVAYTQEIGRKLDEQQQEIEDMKARVDAAGI